MIRWDEKLTRKRAIDGKTRNTDGHEQLVGHGIDDRTDDCLEIVSTGNPAIDQIRDPGIGEQG